MINDVFAAASKGDTTKLKGLLEMNPLFSNRENDDGMTPLGYAAHYGQANAVQLLLEHGADVNALSHSKISYIPSNTALHAAIAGEREMEVIKMLLAHDAKTDIFDSNGHTSLHSAAFHDDQIELIDLLIEHGADIQAKAEGGITALTLAEEKGNSKVAARLIEKGAIE
ncbi:ankyrin repeat domain-containing protein [Paenibacillus sp. LHD-38]|uniref:ankyrin repeat domain-containing protein n=1 Tax=Paenibacillus sp. LHD-38 TaxID=3072143 RepID=UPI00280E50DB|nr:ankyrin repeat domain-containing protein [Paenibacillus sp. LHD-38]MDQ8733417.1 ankyrin repeat domain-containing protein [Paenibacillus sp. LHD-38]